MYKKTQKIITVVTILLLSCVIQAGVASDTAYDSECQERYWLTIKEHRFFIKVKEQDPDASPAATTSFIWVDLPVDRTGTLTIWCDGNADLKERFAWRLLHKMIRELGLARCTVTGELPDNDLSLGLLENYYRVFTCAYKNRFMRQVPFVHNLYTLFKSVFQSENPSLYRTYLSALVWALRKLSFYYTDQQFGSGISPGCNAISALLEDHFTQVRRESISGRQQNRLINRVNLLILRNAPIGRVKGSQSSHVSRTSGGSSRSTSSQRLVAKQAKKTSGVRLEEVRSSLVSWSPLDACADDFTSCSFSDSVWSKLQVALLSPEEYAHIRQLFLYKIITALLEQRASKRISDENDYRFLQLCCNVFFVGLRGSGNIFGLSTLHVQEVQRFFHDDTSMLGRAIKSFIQEFLLIHDEYSGDGSEHIGYLFNFLQYTKTVLQEHLFSRESAGWWRWQKRMLTFQGERSKEERGKPDSLLKHYREMFRVWLIRQRTHIVFL